ncbi:hypothetical protein [Aureivirga sp. CE67]|uniref:hypothetical protein n=1 Tax=Aureivirga sp. CE67 TaxID=1788983 RepID=UPI0018CB5E1C|nr:hypothetical protein [Aureivirga sp. CE67]
MKNRSFLILFIIGFVAVLIGAFNKINGNENASIQLLVGMLLKVISILGLIWNNFSRIKFLFK